MPRMRWGHHHHKEQTMSGTKITAKDQAAIVANLATTLGRKPTADEVKAEIAKRRTPSTPSKAAVQAAAAKATEQAAKVPAKPAKPAKVLPPAPQGWAPTESPNGFLRYSRRSRATSHAISAFNVEHPRCPKVAQVVGMGTDPDFKPYDITLAQVPGTGRFVLVDHNTGATARASSWGQGYAISRTLDGQPAPTAAYLAKYFQPAKPAQDQPQPVQPAAKVAAG